MRRVASQRRFCVAACTALLLGCIDAAAAVGNITTFAGGGSNGDGGPALAAKLTTPVGAAFDAAGNLYFAEDVGHRIRRISTAGIITTIAGTGVQGPSGDGGSALSAALGRPRYVAVDAAGNVYFSDAADHRVRRIDTGGILTVVAGNGIAAFAGDGAAATGASLNDPRGIMVDASGDLFIADHANGRIRKVSGGIITTIAGSGITPCFDSTFHLLPNGDGGPAASAKVQPESIVTDAAGGLYFGDACGLLRRIDAGGTVTRVVGGGQTVPGVTPILAASAKLVSPVGLARDAAGNLYLGDIFWAVYKLDVAGGTVALFAGSGIFGDSGDEGPATAAKIAVAFGLAVDGAGSLWITSFDFNRIRKVDTAGVIHAAAGIGNTPFTGDGGLATAAALVSPGAMAKDAAGNFYFTDSNAVRRVDSSGIVTRFAGGGTGTSDGIAATSALLDGPSGLAFDASGNLFISDRTRVLEVDTTGAIRRVAGQLGVFGFSGDGGPATAATLSLPLALAMDAAGNLFIAEQGNLRVRKLDPAGVITTVAGNGSAAAAGDGALATLSGMTPVDVRVDGQGNLFIADIVNSQVRKVSAAGVISTVAGNGTQAFGGDGGPATAAALNQPTGVDVDADGNVYVADSRNKRVRMISPDGTIATIAGTGGFGTLGDNGPAIDATLSLPYRVRWDAAGALFIADRGNLRVRKVDVVDTTPDTFTFAPQTGVALSSVVQSETVTPTGFAAAAPIAVAGGEYSIGCGATFVSTAGSLAPGQGVCVRQVASSIPNADTVTTLTVGGRSGLLRSTTVTGPGSIALSAATLDFGAQSMNTTSPAQTITLTNSGAVAVSVNAVTIDANFAATDDCATLAPAATCTVRVTFTPRAPGALNGNLTLQNSPGTQLVALTGIGERSLTTHYYQSILRRAPDLAGKAFWESEATRMAGLGANINETWFAMANAFFSSPEYLAFNRSDGEFLVDLYETFFNRAPDAGGSAFWTDQLAHGMPREIVLVSFMLSREFGDFTRAIFGNTAARAEVDVVMDFYRGVLSRLPDQDGFNFWVQRLRAAQCSGSSARAAVTSEVNSISSQFMTSAEYLARNRTNGQFVGDLYNAFLRRGGDPSGVQFWIGQLDTGADTRDGLRKRFLITPEFQLRVGAVINQGCLP